MKNCLKIKFEKMNQLFDLKLSNILVNNYRTIKSFFKKFEKKFIKQLL